MGTIVSRFLTFQETLGKGLVKFAYFVLLALLAITTVIAMISGIVLMFDDFLAGLGRFLFAPIQFVVAAILLRIGAEVVNAILSIDDQLTDGARADGKVPGLRSGAGGSSSGTSGGLGLGEDTEASKDENQAAPFAQAGAKAGAQTSAKGSASGTSSGGTEKGGYEAEKVSTAPAAGSPKPATKGTKAASKKPAKSSAAKTAAAARKSEASARASEKGKEQS